MSPEREPSDLKALFEQSASTADEATLERLQLHALRVPRPARRRWWAPSLLGVAAGVALYVGMPADDARDTASDIAQRTLTPPLGASNAPPSATAPATALSDEREPLTEVDEPVDVLDDLALEPGDLSDAELDAWVSVANASRGG